MKMAFPAQRGRKWLAGFLLAGLLVAVFSAEVSAQENESATDLKLSKKAQSELKAQQARIKKELALGTAGEWSGEYYYGDGLGVNVLFSMAPKTGFAFTWHGCLGLYDENYGDVAFESGRYRLKFRYPNKREGFEGIASEFIPVRWGSRHYLVAADDFVAFVNAVNSGFEATKVSRSHRFLLKLGDESKAVSGFPDVPTEYKTYLLSAPIQARISGIGESKDVEYGRVTRVVIDVGSADGVKPGMDFYVYEPSTVFETVEILSLAEHSAEGELRQFGSKVAKPSADWRLSTYALKGREE